MDDSRARLTSVQARNGYTQTLQYDAGGHLQAVTDSHGRTLMFDYQGDLLRTLTTPDGLIFTYSYDESGASPGTADRLTSVEYTSAAPATSRTYLYEDSSFPFALTGTVDENGDRFATWTYDAQGRATSSQHAGGAELVTIAYSGMARTVTNALGQQEVYTFATLQGIPKVTRIDRIATDTTAAATRIFTYDANGYKTSETDWNGNLTTYVNDARGLPLTITEATGAAQERVTTITYDATQHLPLTITEPGITTILAYDADGNLLTKTLTDTTSLSAPYSTGGEQRTWTYTWSNGLPASEKGPRTDADQTTTYDYDGSGALTRITNPLSQVTKITQHTAGGLPLRLEDPNGVETDLTYDGRLRLVSSTVHASAGLLTTTYDYDAVGNLIRTTLPDGTAVTNTYDMAHRLTGIADRLGQSITFTLDALGDRTLTEVRDAGGTLTRKQLATFDTLGRQLTKTGGTDQVTGYEYDANHNLISVTDPLMRKTQQSYDALNRLVAVTDPAAGTTLTTYDPRDRLLSLTDPNGNTTSYVYDGFGDRIQLMSPDTGQSIYRYDAAGNLAEKMDARGVVQQHRYDALDRVVSDAYPGATTENVTYTYDEPGHGAGVGRLTSVVDEAGSLSLTYDERGNLLSETRMHAPATLVTSYSYDDADRVATITYPSGTVVSYTHDSVGQISDVTAQPAGMPSPMPVVTGIAYQPFGPVAAMTYGNGIGATRTFDPDYRQLSSHVAGNSVVQDLAYLYDPANNVVAITDAIHIGLSQQFAYDNLDRLTQAAGGYRDLGYTYDPVGNRLTVQGGATPAGSPMPRAPRSARMRGNSRPAGSATRYGYAPDSNRLVSINADGSTQAFRYTEDGNIAGIDYTDGEPNRSLQYNQAGRLSGVARGGQQAAQYVYDAFGHRLFKTGASAPTRLYQYDPSGHLIQESDGAGTAGVEYLCLYDEPIATMNRATGSLAFLHTDRLGTPQLATDAAQSVIWEGDYEPFGALSSTSQTALLEQNLRLPGQEFDVETGWHHNGFRDYAPELGRYVESDPIGLAGGVNTYLYGSGNPGRMFDRSGLSSESSGIDAARNFSQGLVYLALGYPLAVIHNTYQAGKMYLALAGAPEKVALGKALVTAPLWKLQVDVPAEIVEAVVHKRIEQLIDAPERAYIEEPMLALLQAAGRKFGNGLNLLSPSSPSTQCLGVSVSNDPSAYVKQLENHLGLQRGESYIPAPSW